METESDDYNAGNAPKKSSKVHNVLPLYGNEASMNLNPLILTNIQSSSYFKVHLFKLKTYHEVVDEIYYQVKHLEPWERGSRKTSGQTGMCGGVRGVGAGGIVSTAFCLLYKLYTLRLTRKQINGLMTHTDSPYIRALGFMYLRYTQPPADLYDWYEEYLQDEEEIDVKAGGGQTITIGQMLYQFLTKLDWFSTLFPRIPVPIQKQIERKLSDYCRDYNVNLATLGVAAQPVVEAQPVRVQRNAREERPERFENNRERFDERDRGRDRDRDRERERGRIRESPVNRRNRSRSRTPEYRNRNERYDGRRRSRSPRERSSRDRDARSERHRHKEYKNRDADRNYERERERDREYGRDRERGDRRYR